MSEIFNLELRLNAQHWRKARKKGSWGPNWVRTLSFSSVFIFWTSPSPSSAVIQIFFFLSHRSSFNSELNISAAELHLPSHTKEKAYQNLPTTIWTLLLVNINFFTVSISSRILESFLQLYSRQLTYSLI